MKWYTKYLQVYEQPFDSAPKEAVDFVKTKLQKLSENKQPLASVILICYNEEKRLLSCLWSLCDNICDFPIEILAVNNNSSDRTESVLQQLGVTYFNELKKGPGHARQCGLNQAWSSCRHRLRRQTRPSGPAWQTRTRRAAPRGRACNQSPRCP